MYLNIFAFLQVPNFFWIRFAAAENNLSVVMYLLKQTHDAYNLLDDRKVNVCWSV